MGIAATALITLVALLPVGLDTLRDSSAKQAEARIVQTILDRYQTGGWLEQAAAGGTRELLLKDRTLYFDQTGSEVESAAAIDCNYAVRVSVGTAPTLQGDAQSNEYLRQVRVRIAHSALNLDTALAEGSGMYRERSVWIALLEQTGPLNAQASTRPSPSSF
jgi:uncharacterized protein (TIGR02598 family)